MRVEFVTDTFAPDVNGVAMTLGRLVGGLRERGHLVHVHHTALKGLQGESNLPSVPLPGYKEVRLGLPGRFKLFKRWKKKRPDVIYVATESPLGYSAIKAASSLGIPVATGFHTNFDQYLERYKLGGLRPAAVAYLKKVHNRADCTFAPSTEVVEKLLEEGIKNVELLGRGVDVELFRPGKRNAALRARWGARDGTPVALVVGRVAAEKNLELAVKSFEQMRRAVPDLKCVIVGDGPLREKLEADHGWIHFAGMQTGEDLAAHYASADVLLFPSETETFGNVLLEGMASGLVAVGYDYAAAARHIREGENGLKAPLGDSERFIEQALNSLVLPSDPDSLRSRARSSVEGLGWHRVVESLETRLRNLTLSKLSRRNVRAKKPKKLKFKTIILSDVHLGTPDSKVKEVVDFLKNSTCERLILNGDIIDGWALKRGSTWHKSHTRFIRTVLKLTEKKNVEVVYLRGNHDDILDRFLPMAFAGIKMQKEFIHQGVNGKRYLVVHGDGFDSVSSNHRWLAWLGAISYEQLLRFNRFYNAFRAWRGKEYFSLSKKVKGKVKSAVSFVDSYQDQLQKFARQRNCEGIICGHIHTPADEEIDGIHYLNSGDWVESLSCIVEHHDGRFEVLYYEDFLRRVHASDLPDEEVAAEDVSETAGRRMVDGKVVVHS